jgi:hypothetical protein
MDPEEREHTENEEAKSSEETQKEPGKTPQEGAEPGPQETPQKPPEPLRVKDLILVLIVELANKAWAYMGKIAHRETGEPKTDLEQARFAIDTIEAVLNAVRDKLEEEEIKNIEQVLSDLRANFVALG